MRMPNVYEKLDANPTLIYTKEVKEKIDEMLKIAT